MRIGLLVGVCGALLALMLLALHANEKARCEEYGRAVDKQTDYVLIRGCIVEARPEVWISRSVLD